MLAIMKRSNWWIVLLCLFVVGLSGLALVGVRTYRDAPPIPDFVAPDGRVLVSSESVLDGQAVFQKYALMEHGSFFGDGANRGPDYTADALHELVVAMSAHMRSELGGGSALELAGVEPRVRAALKENTYNSKANAVALTPSEAAALPALVAHYEALFSGDGPEAMKPAHYIRDREEVRKLAAFFFWGAWTCAATRPGAGESYTHDWPYDPAAGNVPGAAVLVWSVLGALGLIVALGAVLYVRGRLPVSINGETTRAITEESLAAFRPTPAQRASYRFFALAATLFVLQVLAGVLTVHDFVGFTKYFGVDTAEFLPITVVRSWHVLLSLVWISACWIGASIFVLPFLTGGEPRGQARLAGALFWLLVTIVVGSAVGIALGPLGKLGGWWRLLGNQGWEYVELGRLWQGLLFASFALWAGIVARGAWSAVRAAEPFTLPNMLVAAVVAILLFLGAGFVAGPRSNFVVADFWRWCVVHMWAEAFFEVFTTIVVAYFMVLMGLASREGAVRTVYAATLLFLGSGLLGISHNFYWNAKPMITLAIGSVFSTLQVVPLVLLALEAWRVRELPGHAKDFAHREAFSFILAVNFWNFFGAGVFGFIINLPIVNYYEHGTYLTVNHGHAALMGVYGNLSIAAIVFASRYLVAPSRWNAPLLRIVFWSLNVGLALMVLLDLFPAGLLQLQAVFEGGLWAARSRAFVEGDAFQTVTWMRIVGGALFVTGGVLPLAAFVLSRSPQAPRDAGHGENRVLALSSRACPS